MHSGTDEKDLHHERETPLSGTFCDKKQGNDLVSKERKQAAFDELTPPGDVRNKDVTHLIALSYLSFGLGYGPFMPLGLAWVFRKNSFLSQQLLQSGLLQSLFYAISLALLWGAIGFTYSYQNPSLAYLNELLPFFHKTLDWMIRIVLFILSLFVLKHGSISLPLFNEWTLALQKYCAPKRLRRAVFLTLLWPGLGHLYLGKSWLAWILIFSQVFLLTSLFYLSFAYFNFAAAKDLLTILGFYIRVGDKVFSEGFVNLQVIGLNLGLLIFNYLLALFNLPIGRAWRSFRILRANETQRRFATSLSFSFIMHLGLMWILLLLPFILNKASSEKTIQQRAEQIYKQLEEDKRKLEKQKADKKTKPPEVSSEREMEFNLELPEQVNGLNEFSDKAFAPKPIQDPINKPPTIGFSDKPKILPSKKNYVKQLSKDAKSYSEYLTAKVREGRRDRLIWDQAPNPYSVVMEYTVDPNGRIADIRVVESSNDLQTDSLVISVLQSMNPLIKPPKGHTLKVTELFWNTGGQRDLDTEMKRSLATYPDGRVIEMI